MRISTIMFASILAAAAFTGCGKNDPATGDDGPDAGNGSGSNDPNAAFTIQSTDLTIQPGDEVTQCYWFHTPNTTALSINKWVSDMTPGSHHMIFFAGGAEHADGISPNDCGFSTSQGLSQPQWVFASQTAHLEENLPPDDGAGKPLAQVIAPNTVGAFQMHYINTTDNPLAVHVKLAAYALPDATAFTRTDAYVTYQTNISIPKDAVGYNVPGSCSPPANVKFWTVSTHAHKQAVETQVLDATTMVFDSTDWEHPGSKNWDATPFYTFTGKVNWSCTYNNTGDNHGSVVVQGQSALTQEMCMATGYYFPATKPMFCVASGPSNCQCI